MVSLSHIIHMPKEFLLFPSSFLILSDGFEGDPVGFEKGRSVGGLEDGKAADVLGAAVQPQPLAEPSAAEVDQRDSERPVTFDAADEEDPDPLDPLNPVPQELMPSRGGWRAILDDNPTQ